MFCMSKNPNTHNDHPILALVAAVVFTFRQKRFKIRTDGIGKRFRFPEAMKC